MKLANVQRAGSWPTFDFRLCLCLFEAHGTPYAPALALNFPFPLHPQRKQTASGAYVGHLFLILIFAVVDVHSAL
jgi:hypothetical protein